MLTCDRIGCIMPASHINDDLKGGVAVVGISFRGVVYSKYKSISEFANKIGWTRQKGANIINGITEPSLDDVDKMAKALDLTFEETARFFLPARSQV